MTRLLVIICALGSMLGVAHAMNWEGHDDWMAELPAARQLKAAGGKAVNPVAPPAKQERCMRREEAGQVQPNPYENILPLCPERRRPAK